MESSIIKQRYSLCILASFFGFLFLSLYHDRGQHLITIVSSLTSSSPAESYKVSITEINIISSPQNASASRVNSTVSTSQVDATISTSQLDTTVEIVSSREKMEVSLKLNSSASENLEMLIEEEKEEGECDIFDGMWVYDPKNYPLYHGHQCPFLSNQVSCQKNGRPDSDYEHWRWKPRGCEIPRFNGTHMLERLRGKRMAIVGDSLNRNQWESMACLLYSSIKPWRAFVKLNDVHKIFQALVQLYLSNSFTYKP